MSVEPVVSRCDCCGTQYTARAWPWLESLGGDGSRRVCAVPGCGSTVDRRPVAANARGGAPRPRAVTVPVEVTIVEVPLPSVPEARVFSAFVESTDPHDCGPVVFLSQGQSLAITGPGFDFEGTLAEFCDAMRARSTMARGRGARGGAPVAKRGHRRRSSRGGAAREGRPLPRPRVQQSSVKLPT